MFLIVNFRIQLLEFTTKLVKFKNICKIYNPKRKIKKTYAKFTIQIVGTLAVSLVDPTKNNYQD